MSERGLVARHMYDVDQLQPVRGNNDAGLCRPVRAYSVCPNDFAAVFPRVDPALPSSLCVPVPAALRLH